MLEKVLYHIKEKYVDPSKISAEKMFEDALGGIQDNIAEVIVREKKSGFKEIIVASAKMVTETDVKDLDELQSRLSKILVFVKKNATSELKDVDLEVNAIKGILDNFDPHSILLSPELYNETTVNTQGSFGGLGIIIALRDAKLTIIAPIDDTPAYRAGLKAGDHIMKIEDESTINMTLSEAVDRMRGKKGQPCNITINRNGFKSPKEYKIIRDIIIVKSVESHRINDSIGYVRIKNFQSHTNSDLFKHLRKLEAQMNPIKGLILDLRSNPGGLLDQAIKVSDIFLEQGTIVTTVAFGKTRREVENAHNNRIEPKYPIAVLVDGGSASASEIVAGALKNNNKAIVIGRQTFGKGSVQSIYKLPENYALKLTIAEYLTPGDKSIQSYGIMPDIMVLPVRIDTDNMNLFRSERRIREEDLDKAFEESQPHYEKPLYQVKYYFIDKESENDDTAVIPKEESEKEKLKKIRKDFEVRMASEIISQSQFTDRELIMKSIGGIVKKYSRMEKKKINKALAELNVNWKMSEKTIKRASQCSPPTASININNNVPYVTAGSEIPIEVVVSNSGKCHLYKLWAISHSDYPFFSDREIIFGNLNPNQTVKRKINIKVPEIAENKSVTFSLTFDEKLGNLPTSVTKDFIIKGLNKPVFALNYQIVDDGTFNSEGNGNSLIEKGEKIALILSTKNIGLGTSKENLSALKNESGQGILLIRGRNPLGELKPGDIKTSGFLFEVRDYYDKYNIDLNLTVYDSIFREYITETLKLKVWLNPPKPKKLFNIVTPKTDHIRIFSSPYKDSPVMATLKKSAVLKSTAYVPNYYKVSLSNTRSGWVLSSKVKNAKAQPTDKPDRFIKYTMRKIPPQIILVGQKRIPLSTKEEYLNIRGILNDDNSLKDMFVLVNNKKVFYKSLYSKNSPMKKGSFEIKIKLDEGINALTFVARDNEDLTGKKRYYITRKVPGAKVPHNTARIFKDTY